MRRSVLAVLAVVSPTLGDEERREYQTALVLTWLALPALASVVLACMGLLGMGIDLSSLAVVLAAACITPSVVIFSTSRFDATISSLSSAFAFVSITGPVVVMYTYVQTAMGASYPLIDPLLSRADAMLGFDWKAAMAWADSLARDFPAADAVAKGAYESIVLQFSAVFLLLSLTGQYARLQRFLICYVVSVVAVGTLCRFIPAVGAYEYYAITPDMHPHLRLSMMNAHLADYLALRDGSYETFRLVPASGIVTFPSFHATLAVMFAWAYWRTPYVRWIGLAVNLAMLASTPLYGSHFLTDLIAGVAIAPPVIMSSGWIRRRSRGWLGPILRMPPAEVKRR